VAAEVVVVVENENARGRAGGLAEEPGRGQPADAGADDDEIVALAAIGDRARVGPERSVAQRVGCLERAVVATAETGEGGRIQGRVVGQERERFARRERPADGERDAVEEIAPRQALRRL
jgi:hypothetical protein